jgi:hypothetical protein
MSRGDEVLVPGPDQDVLLCCSGCSKLTLICPISLASYKWLKFRHIDWYEKAWGGGRSCNKCGPRIERLRQSGTYTVSVTFGGMCTVHFAFEVSLVLLLFAVVTIGKLISMYVCYFCLTFCQSEISWLRHTRASIARVSVGEPQCVGVPPKAHWVDMTKNAKKWNNQR